MIYGSGNTINPYPFNTDYTFEGNVETVTFTGTESNKSYDRLNGTLFKTNSTPYAAWGEGQITLHFQYIKANAVATGDTATGSGTSGTLFSNLDPTKQYGVKVVVTNATPGSAPSLSISAFTTIAYFPSNPVKSIGIYDHAIEFCIPAVPPFAS